MLGPPGAGKGTQAAIVAEKLDLPHVSSGNLFRENIKNETELGKKVKSILDAGNLVPDDLTIDMVRDRISRDDCNNGAILDGFPRTPAQAEALNAMLVEFAGKVDVVPYINVEDDELIRRLSGRRTCRENGHIFNLTFNPPKQEGVCDLDGSELYQRDDDKPETVKERIRVYLEKTSPLIDFYRQAGLLVEIDGGREIELVTNDLLGILSVEG
ncbi:MAG: adenylate kinase [Chloroflexi bacterium]|nr:MAG: adenylate kinase [Chloroflexota bacterium]MBL1196666.1 adenylate kinase [Chloroflexota bacterium]NOH13959.1 adenylate kinase [Chloroflexota bacterium]